MQLFNSATSNQSAIASTQQQTQNPILQGVKSVLSKLLIVKSFTSMLLGDNSLETVGELTYGLLETPA